jgi:hypothetical protein
MDSHQKTGIDGVDHPIYHPVDMVNLRINGTGMVTVLQVHTYREVQSWCAALAMSRFSSLAHPK